MHDDSPLSEQHFTQIQQALAALDRADRHIQMARMAGIDVALQEKASAEARDKLLRIKQVYFPGR